MTPMSEAHPYNVNRRPAVHLNTKKEEIDATEEYLWSQLSLHDRLSRGQPKW